MPSGAHVGREVLAGKRGAGGDEVGGRALEDDPAAVVAGARAEVDDPVGVRHDRLVMLDNDDRLAGVDEPVQQAQQLLDIGEMQAGGRLVQDVHTALLGHVGCQLETLSLATGQRRQRLKLATHMGEKGGVYVLDEPTTGLHLADVQLLLGLLDRLVDSGKSVIVIAHHQAVMARADWIIDLGPGAGHDGGRIVFEGTPADLVAARSTLTGEHLATYVGS